MKIVISASRRTDLPRWYLPETMDHFKQGSITLPNPMYKEKTYTIDLRPENVACIVWWSKDYKLWLDYHQRDPSFFTQYHHSFQFTLNGYSDPAIQSLLERGVTTSFADRLQQLRDLATLYSPDAINWRFDPIVYWRDATGRVYNNIADFVTIAKVAADIGIKRCTIAFCEWTYKHANRRAKARYPDLTFFEPSIAEQQKIAASMGKMLHRVGMQLYSCAHHQIVDHHYVLPSSCINGEILGQLYHDVMDATKDPSQRLMCGCTKSRDIGDYNQRCMHGCIWLPPSSGSLRAFIDHNNN